MAQPDPISIALIGCGKMGSALLRGWLASGQVKHVYVLDPGGLPEEFEDEAPARITYYDKPDMFAGARPPASVFVIAVKPQIMDQVCTVIKKAVPEDALVLSIAAGQTIAKFEGYFDTSQPVIRSMPNTPAAVAKGITVGCPNKHVSTTQKTLADNLLKAVGKVEWIADEGLMDAVTAVSGSGPAYIFLLIEAMAAAGEKAGLEKNFAMKLARQTVIGSAALAESDPLPAETLRKNVTSPGGTTAAALELLMAPSGMQDLFDKAIAAATARSKELSR